ncbi:MAG: glycosyltransferase family 4 protein [Prevotella sp.]|nr:glycosyltransferase family 4 protein [Prevotella sp.]
MRVLIVNTSELNGGAAVAACRLMEALNNNGVKAKMLVRDRAEVIQHDGMAVPERITVASLPRSPWLRWHFLWERLVIFCYLHFSRKHLFDIDLACAGSDITRLPEFKEADVIHLHWVNQGMLSLDGIRKILQSGKPVVWTMHDVWPATAICHLTLGCRNFTTGCCHCRYLPGGGSNHDLSAVVWERKRRLLEGSNISFVACSRWLEGEARQSKLLQGQQLTSIPNPIDTRVFCPGSQAEARRQEQLPADKRLLLFVCQSVTNRYKGMEYLVEACRQLAAAHPEMVSNTAVVIMGGHADEVAAMLPFEAYPLGYVSDEHRIVSVFRAADAFVLPSLSENLPNTIMEAMACGVPCVGFRVGGIPEMIDHRKNGYVARYEDADDLAQGIRWVLFEADHDELSRQCVTKVTHSYSQSIVSLRYIEVYQHALAQRHFHL